MSVPEFLETLKKQAQERAMMMRRMQAQQQGGQMPQGPPGAQSHPHQHPNPQQMMRGPPPGAIRQPITPGPPKPAALALAKFLRGQDLKPRTCILNGERKDMFKGMDRTLVSGRG
jgi:translocation protein SEC62